MRNHLHQIIHIGGVGAMLLIIGPIQILGQDATEDVPVDQSLNSIHARDIIEAVMEHHIDPPTRQQLVLEVLRGVTEAESDRLPSDLSTRISAISDTDALYKLLDDELAKFGNGAYFRSGFDQYVVAPLNKVVPGGVKVMPQKEYAVNEQLTANRYVGIGVNVTMNQEVRRLQLNTVHEGGTAASSGLFAGDIVEAVDDKDTLQISINEVIDWIRGPEGSVVRLKVRSPGKEPREVEIVRSVVPMKTLNVVEQAQDTTAVLIRIDRLTSSTVHELRKIIDDLPVMATTIILDLRFTTDSTTHHLHLLANALLHEGRLGQMITRSGARLLTTEAGTILKNRKAAIVYRPGYSEQIDWLATVLHERKFPVFRDAFSLFFEIPDEMAAARQSIIEFVPTRDGTHYIGLATTELLTSGAERINHINPAGQSIQPYTAKSSTSYQWLAKLVGLDDVAKYLSAPMAVTTDQDGILKLSPRPAASRPHRAPATDAAIVERIAAYLKVQ